ncbi:MAG: T9SS type A sorting domain-containing protein [Ignavibacteriae bacterium]|nr:T9SS type A sorting domain-containing protein [Ignavibacteriota bacterium]MCB9206604.1 T9SS type A sorting domain-containing protein [Ignavibacteriales bacterium]MCB9209692.1 T9SS type A sorting domain-containing protein [Ignavibacteriales bacterium]MCB9218848.1 T9SS type A sorting domain-containing protein [Ignavibacteriales bacterium]
MKYLTILFSLLFTAITFGQPNQITYTFYVDGCNVVPSAKLFSGVMLEGEKLVFEDWDIPVDNADYQFFYNLMVGGELGFPEQSLKEDIHIDIILSGLCDLNLTNLPQNEGILQLLYLKMIVTGAQSGLHSNNDYYYLENNMESFLRLPLTKLLGFLNYVNYSIDDFTPFFVNSESKPDLDGIRKVEEDEFLSIYSRHFSTIGVGFKMDDPVDPTGVDDLGTKPNEFVLSQNYPNPFNPETSIAYSLADAGVVKISIFNSIGEEIQTLVNESKSAGNYNVSFNASNLPSGIYFYQMTSGNFTQTKRMILMK